jgi:hypothetical protein
MMQVQGSGRPIFRRSGAILAVLTDLGLMESAEGQYRVNPVIPPLLTGDQESGAEPAGPAVVLHGDYGITVHPHGDFRKAVLLPFCAALREFDMLSRYELSRQSVFRALSRGIDGGQIIAVFEDLSRAQVPQNIRFSIESWIGEFRSVELNAGYLIRCDEKSRPLIEHTAESRSDVIRISQDAYLFPRHTLDWVDELEDRDCTSGRCWISNSNATATALLPSPPFRQPGPADDGKPRRKSPQPRAAASVLQKNAGAQTPGVTRPSDWPPSPGN